MARKAGDLVGKVERAAERRIAWVEPLLADLRLAEALDAPAPDAPREGRRHVLGEAQGLADLADRAARAVADDGGGDAGALAAIFLVDVLDHLLAPLVLEIDIDVGRLVALGRDEALEEEVDA